MTETPTPTNAEEAAAMTVALNSYHAAKLVEAREFVGSDTFADFRGMLEAILAEGLPEGPIKSLISSIITMINSLSVVSAHEDSLAVPTEEPLV